MELSQFVSSTVVSLVQALARADSTLQEQKLGQIWKLDLDTNSKDLVSVRLGKGKSGTNQVSVPLMFLDFDVKFTVDYSAEGTAKAAAEGNVGAAGSLLKVIGVGGNVSGSGEASLAAARSDVQNLKFTVPVQYHYQELPTEQILSGQQVLKLSEDPRPRR